MINSARNRHLLWAFSWLDPEMEGVFAHRAIDWNVHFAVEPTSSRDVAEVGKTQTEEFKSLLLSSSTTVADSFPISVPIVMRRLQSVSPRLKLLPRTVPPHITSFTYSYSSGVLRIGRNPPVIRYSVDGSRETLNCDGTTTFLELAKKGWLSKATRLTGMN